MPFIEKLNENMLKSLNYKTPKYFHFLLLETRRNKSCLQCSSKCALVLSPQYKVNYSTWRNLQTQISSKKLIFLCLYRFYWYNDALRSHEIAWIFRYCLKLLLSYRFWQQLELEVLLWVDSYWIQWSIKKVTKKKISRKHRLR